MSSQGGYPPSIRAVLSPFHRAVPAATTVALQVYPDPPRPRSARGLPPVPIQRPETVFDTAFVFPAAILTVFATVFAGTFLPTTYNRSMSADPVG
jgi:hypothetical protein